MAGDTKNFAAWMRTSDIQSSITRCGNIFNSGIFNAGNSSGVLFEASITLLLVHLNDLLQKANVDKQRIDFSDDVDVTDSVSDVTDVVRAARNAACHVTSGEHKLDSGKFTFCVASGYGPRAYVINGVEMGCNFEDDIAIYYGSTRVYVRRHLLRSFEMVSSLYQKGSNW